MKEGYRVLTLAYRRIDTFNNKVIDREELEKDLIFAGLLILNCPMKTDTPLYLRLLTNANYRNIMITGDNMFTAAKTGQTLMFSKSNKNLFLKTKNDKFFWHDIDDKSISELTYGVCKKLEAEYCLCVEGTEMKELFYKDKKLFIEMIESTIIFARVSPDQKEQIVRELKEKKNNVLM